MWRKQTVSNNPEVGVSWESISEAAERLKASIAEQLLFGGLPTAVVDSPLIVKQTITIQDGRVRQCSSRSPIRGYDRNAALA